MPFAVIALDATFWQALSKSLDYGRIGDTSRYDTQAWSKLAHEFYDLILQGKDTEDFWNELIN